MKKSERFLLNMRRSLDRLAAEGIINTTTLVVASSSLSYTIVPTKQLVK